MHRLAPLSLFIELALRASNEKAIDRHDGARKVSTEELTPRQLAEFVQSESAKWSEVAKKSGVQPE